MAKSPDLIYMSFGGIDLVFHWAFCQFQLMHNLVARFGKLINASFVIMVIGVIVFALTIPLYAHF